MSLAYEVYRTDQCSWWLIGFLFSGFLIYTTLNACHNFCFEDWFPGWSQFQFRNRQPSDDGYSDEDCVEIRDAFHLPVKGVGFTKQFFWNDRNCNVKNPYICQRFKTGKMVVINGVPCRATGEEGDTRQDFGCLFMKWVAFNEYAITAERLRYFENRSPLPVCPTLLRGDSIPILVPTDC